MVSARIRVAGYRRAVLWVLEANDAARRFYETDGWAPDGARREEDVWGVDARVMRYQRLLGEDGDHLQTIVCRAFVIAG